MLLRKSWLNTRRMLLGDFEPDWSGGDSGTRWTPVEQTLSETSRHFVVVICCGWNVEKHGMNVVFFKLKIKYRKDQDSWLSGDQFRFNSFSVKTIFLSMFRRLIASEISKCLKDRLGVGSRVLALVGDNFGVATQLLGWPGDNKISQVQFQLSFSSLKVYTCVRLLGEGGWGVFVKVKGSGM